MPDLKYETDLMIKYETMQAAQVIVNHMKYVTDLMIAVMNSGFNLILVR